MMSSMAELESDRNIIPLSADYKAIKCFPWNLAVMGADFFTDKFRDKKPKEPN